MEVTKGSSTESFTGKVTPGLAAGSQYNYTLNVGWGKDLVVTGATITDWTQEANQDVTMTE